MFVNHDEQRFLSKVKIGDLSLFDNGFSRINGEFYVPPISNTDAMRERSFADAGTQVDHFLANETPFDAIGCLDHRRNSIRTVTNLHQAQVQWDTFSIEGIRSNQVRYVSTSTASDLSKDIADLNNPTATRG